MEDDVRVAAGRVLLGRRLRECRRSSGLTLRQAHARSGLSVSYLSELERGVRLPPLDTLLALADAYGSTVEALLHKVYPFGATRRPRRLPDRAMVPRRDPGAPDGASF